jgi:hypothetical protein
MFAKETAMRRISLHRPAASVQDAAIFQNEKRERSVGFFPSRSVVRGTDRFA